MMIGKRSLLLLEYLLKVKSVNMNQIMDTTQLTKRQISYDLDKVNHWLKEKELPIIPFKGIHFIAVPDAVLEYFGDKEISNHEQNFVFSEEERLAVIYLYVFMRNDTISSFHLTQLLQVSKNTVISDLKKANKINCSFLVEIRYSRKYGYHLNGTEFDKRALVMHYISRLMQVPYFEKLLNYLLKEEAQKIDFRGILNILKQIEKQFSLDFVEERLNQLANFLIFYYYRQQKKKFVQFHSDEVDLLKKDPMHKVAIMLSQLLHFENDESELCYLTVQFLGLSFGKSSVPNSKQDLLFKLCEQLVLDFETKTCIVFEKKEEVVRTLYKHFKPAFFRMKYRIPVENPLLNQIKSEHKELYMIVKEMMHPIGTLMQITIPEEEIGFITIHFGALLEKPRQEMLQKKKAIVVCPSGISSSLMVKHQLESLFSEIMVEKTLSLREFQEDQFDHYDLVFSTVRLETKLPCFYVKPIMTPTEKHNLVNEVYHLLFGIQNHAISLKKLIQIIEKFTTIHDEEGLKQELDNLTFYKKENVYKGKRVLLEDLLHTETIQVIEEVFDWKEAVKVAANPLLANGTVEESYIEAMIENIDTLGPYVVIGPEVAISHARPEKGVNRIGMSLLSLKKPVYFLNNNDFPVRLLFCMAATDNTTHLKALSQLTELLSEKNNLKILKDLESIDEIRSFFSQNATIN